MTAQVRIAIQPYMYEYLLETLGSSLSVVTEDPDRGFRVFLTILSFRYCILKQANTTCFPILIRHHSSHSTL
jgi:hypothetical protein